MYNICGKQNVSSIYFDIPVHPNIFVNINIFVNTDFSNILVNPDIFITFEFFGILILPIIFFLKTVVSCGEFVHPYRQCFSPWHCLCGRFWPRTLTLWCHFWKKTVKFFRVTKHLIYIQNFYLFLIFSWSLN